MLRLTADEALFVGDPKHRNALFGMITEPTLEIEPKGCGIYMAPNYLNTTMLSNAEHYIPVSDTARRFFAPTVSIARMGDHDYFAALQEELDNGGYEALLYHLLNEVDLDGLQRSQGAADRRRCGSNATRAYRRWKPGGANCWRSGTLRGSDPEEPCRAVSNGYQRTVKVELKSGSGGTHQQLRTFQQPGIYDQAKQIEPRLRTYTNDHKLGHFLAEMGCDNTRKVLRRQGWSFPSLKECRAKWEKAIPTGNGAIPDLDAVAGRARRPRRHRGVPP